MARLRALDPKLPLEDAEEIAIEMHEFERTGVMEPEAAVDFVVAQMRDEPSARFESARFERRGAKKPAP